MKAKKTVIFVMIICIGVGVLSSYGWKEGEGATVRQSDEKVLCAELKPQECRERIADAPIAYLPLGTLEWHGEYTGPLKV